MAKRETENGVPKLKSAEIRRTKSSMGRAEGGAKRGTTRPISRARAGRNEERGREGAHRRGDGSGRQRRRIDGVIGKKEEGWGQGLEVKRTSWV